MITESREFRRNNLDKSASPYLLQHVANPVWWQEWNEDVINYVRESGKPIFVSVGYATCHWCHVMAAGAFSDAETAYFLNEHFISIKIDREQRPDIDQMMMDFIQRQNGSGGWPLNVFLTSSLKPVYALTFAPAKPGSTTFSFLDIADKVLEFIRINSEKVPDFVPTENKSGSVSEHSVIKMLSEYYDNENGGFGHSQKFPPHSTLLFLLYQMSIEDSPSLNTIVTKTLDSMVMRGLNDHLQGGIFRYCVDTEWTIPHFEKMLYDQAMALWCYSLAFRITGREHYKKMSLKILRCLDETFLRDGLYITAHDADTDHVEGLTYLWSYDELEEALGESELKRLADAYYISPSGNFEKKNHLIRRNSDDVSDIEEKLLSIRRSRKQPGEDGKILSGLNALAATALIQMSRCLDMLHVEERAAALVKNIRNVFWKDGRLSHSLFANKIQEQSFLFDTASLLHVVTMLSETGDEWVPFMDELAANLKMFNSGGRWIESDSPDFMTVFASWFDHPIPSGAAMAENALTRYSVLKGEDIQSSEYHQPFSSDFYNINSMIRNGLFHIYTSREKLGWSNLPVNSIQARGIHEQDCFMGVCRPLYQNAT
ncbi:MAG TPA: DUF255 domain-containing protein [Bacteroidales bacterium]|nr:DUF255 domain-containing protein [Bacteroidales bacterium]